MSILTRLKEAYARWRKNRYKKNWDDDFHVLLRRTPLDNPFNPQGLNLALLHLKKVHIEEPHFNVRRSLNVYTSTTTIEQLYMLLTKALRHVESGNSMSSDFFPSDVRRLHQFDDYFVSLEGHVVSIEVIVNVLGTRLVQLISKLEDWEVNDSLKYEYYNRRLTPLFCDTFFVLQAIHSTSYQ